MSASLGFASRSDVCLLMAGVGRTEAAVEVRVGGITGDVARGEQNRVVHREGVGGADAVVAGRVRLLGTGCVRTQRQRRRCVNGPAESMTSAVRLWTGVPEAPCPNRR